MEHMGYVLVFGLREDNTDKAPLMAALILDKGTKSKDVPIHLMF